MTRKHTEETALQTFIPAESFEGYPFDPKGSAVIFMKGQESIPVPADYVALLRDKDLVAKPEADSGAAD